MKLFVSLQQRIIPLVVFLLGIALVDSLHWDKLQSEALPSHGLYTEPTLRDVTFRDVSFTLAMLSWTVDGIRDRNLVSIEMFVKRLSKTGDIVWEPLSQLSFNHPVTANSTHAIRFQRDLNVIHGEAYRGTVKLISGTKNMTSTADLTTVPFGPKTVNLNILETGRIKAVAATFGGSRTGAYFGQLETTNKQLAGSFGPNSLDHPRLTESEVWIDTPLPFMLVPGQTYRVVIAFSSWGRSSSTFLGSNFMTVAPVAPVIEETRLLSNNNIRVTWMLPTGIADTFIFIINFEKRVIKGDKYVISVGRYSAEIDGLKNSSSYHITVTAESNRTQGPKSDSLIYRNTDGFPNDREGNTSPVNSGKPVDDVHCSNGNVIAPWVISGILALIVLCLAVILGLTIRKLRRLQSTIKKSDNRQSQPVYETIRTSYLHPI